MALFVVDIDDNIVAVLTPQNVFDVFYTQIQMWYRQQIAASQQLRDRSKSFFGKIRFYILAWEEEEDYNKTTPHQRT